MFLFVIFWLTLHKTFAKYKTRLIKCVFIELTNRSIAIMQSGLVSEPKTAKYVQGLPKYTDLRCILEGLACVCCFLAVGCLV